MTREELIERVQKVVCQHLDVPKEKVTLSAGLIADLGADSLDAIEVVMAVEEEFDLELNDAVAHEIQTFGDLVDELVKQLGVMA